MKTKTAIKHDAEKRTSKKLRLARETLRILSAEELRSVAGAGGGIKGHPTTTRPTG